MGAPWEKYAQATPPPSAQPAPWEKYGSQNAQPGVESIGVTDGPTPAAKEGAAQKVISAGKTTLGAGAKILDTPRGLTGAPLLGALLNMTTGKSAYTLKDLENTINPTTTAHAPSSAEMFERAGVPEGAKLSDVMGGYSEPGQGQHWYSAEKGGMLDPTLRGTGGLAMDTAIDPLTYLSFGASAAAKQGLAKSASKIALEDAARESATPVSKALDMAGNAAGTVGPLAMNPGLAPAMALAPKVAAATAESPFLQKLTMMAQLPSKTIGAIGERMYGSPLMAIEHDAERFGKASPGEILYRGGVMTPNNLPAKAQGIVDTVLNQRNKILDMAGEQGGRMDMQAAMEPARETARQIRKADLPNTGWMADELGSQIAEHIRPTIGTPAVEAVPAITKPGLAGGRVEVAPAIEGVEAIPGKDFTPREGATMTTNLYNDTPKESWNVIRKTPVGKQITAPLFKGTREEYLRQVENTLGPEARANVEDLNATAGPLLSTGKAQERVSRQAERTLNSATSIDGLDAVATPLAAAAGGEHGLEKGLWAFLGRKAMQTARYGQMPAGYGVRKLAEGEMTGPALDALLREKFIKNAGTPANPWSNIGDENGR